MFILYVDGSGTPDQSDPNSKLFVLAGLCVHEGTWYALEERVTGLKRNYALPGSALTAFELHAKDICCSYSEQTKFPDFTLLEPLARRAMVLEKRREKLASMPEGHKRDKLKTIHRATDPYIHLTRQERSCLYEDGLDLVGDHDGIRLFAEIVDKGHLNQSDATQPALAQLVSRFDAFLKNYNKRSPRSPENGLLVMDKEPTRERQIENIFDEYRAEGHPWGKINHVIESPFFVDSRRANAVQLVDLCAYAVRRYVERGAVEGSFEEQNFLRIFHKFDRSGPRLHGLRHYCPRGSCGCLICRDRGHAKNESE